MDKLEKRNSCTKWVPWYVPNWGCAWLVCSVGKLACDIPEAHPWWTKFCSICLIHSWRGKVLNGSHYSQEIQSLIVAREYWRVMPTPTAGWPCARPSHAPGSECEPGVFMGTYCREDCIWHCIKGSLNCCTMAFYLFISLQDDHIRYWAVNWLLTAPLFEPLETCLASWLVTC